MEIQVNDLVKVQYDGNELIGQVYKYHSGLQHVDVMLPHIGLKRFPLNCIIGVSGREEIETLLEEAPQQEDTTSSNIDFSFSDGSYTVPSSDYQSDLPNSDGPASNSEPDFGGGGGFSGGGGGDSWSDSGQSDGSSDTGSSE